MERKIGTNMIPAINYIMSSIPNDLSDLEKLRYIYINLGKIFSYDYRIIVDESVADEKIDLKDNEINRYKTCYQISEILVMIVNGLLKNCKASIIERKIPGRSFKREHVATEVTLSDGMKLLLDLTLDLSNIQSGMRTKEFGFTTNASNDYDIISQRECEDMDKKLGFITDKYTDDYIAEFVEEINSHDFSNMSKTQIVEFKINKAKETLFKNFVGNHEAIRYISTLLNRILTPEERSNLKQYNLSYENSDEMNLLSIYSFNDLNLNFSYSNELGFNKISSDGITDLLKNGWYSNSNTIYDIFADEDTKKKDKLRCHKSTV